MDWLLPFVIGFSVSAALTTTYIIRNSKNEGK